MPFKIAPSLMCADLLQLRRDIEELERAEVDLFHIDVMDGHFVPNLALSFDLARQVKACTAVPLDMHLMVQNPEGYTDALQRLNPSYVSFHMEATRNPIRLARTIKDLGIKAGIALNPSTPAEALTYVLEEFDYVLVMTVEPGFAGQKFLPQMLEKIARVRQMANDGGSRIPIEVDGNLSAESASQCLARGASILVAGTSSVFCGTTDLYTACLDFRRRLSRIQDERLEPVSEIRT